ncbi:hypothetical protein TrVFT333_008177 [Trichoderma virens FT-333]|nr:hypothetical protein TrVFT333_008177 [Trichoderma virens FT-333]
MEIFGADISLPIYVANLGLIGVIFLAVCIFAALKQRNYTFDLNTLLATITLTVLWGATCCFNIGIVIGAFVKCHLPRFKHDKGMKYCHFFGNEVVAKSSGWEGKSWPVYYWISLVSALIMAFWQMLNWMGWIKDIRRALSFRRRRQQNQLNEWA